MNNNPAIYEGRIVSKKNFRAFVYSPNGTKKLVESWDEFQKHMETGLWFVNAEAACCASIKPTEPEPLIVPEKPKTNTKKKAADDFLSKTR
jgi:hypothetical protein